MGEEVSREIPQRRGTHGESPDPGWSAGLHLGIPFTHHTFSIMVTKVTSRTLQKGTGVPDGLLNNVYWGFEFTVPFSGCARWGHPDASDGAGVTYEHTFSARGDFGYHCTPHPFMIATLTAGGRR